MQPHDRDDRQKRIWETVLRDGNTAPQTFCTCCNYVGLQIGSLLSGAVLTETIFSFPGIGRMLFESIVVHDYPVVQMVTLVIASIYVMANLLVDISYAALDPRIRLK